MRISTSMIYDIGVSQLGSLQSSLVKTQQQIGTGTRILTPADDPIASARVLQVTQSDAINTQQVTNRNSAKSSLTQVSSILTSVTTLIQDVQTLAVSVGNGAYSDSERSMLATELNGRFDDLLAQANSADGAGGYLFSGYRSATLPFTQTATGASYQGDQGQRELLVGSSRQLAISASGAEIFENNKSGNGTFSVAAGTNAVTLGANTGTAVIDSSSVTDTTAIKHHNYDITFTVDPVTGGTTYNVADKDNGGASAASGTYVAGQSISFDGMQVAFKGAPADGDTMSVAPSSTQSLFTTLRSMITAISTPATTGAARAALSNAMANSGASLNSALDNVLAIQATMGANLKELDYLDSAGSSMTVQYAQTLQQLQDLDYTKAISQLSQQQTTLEAAQKSFKAVTGLSLFSLL